MIHLYCGDGKGNTTAAMGLALRTAPFASGDVYVGGADAADGNPGTREEPVATLAEAFSRISMTGDESISSFTVHVNAPSGTGGSDSANTSASTASP